jgi:hypothetical protein
LLTERDLSPLNHLGGDRYARLDELIVVGTPSTDTE